MACKNRLHLLLFCASIVSSLGFGPRFEPLHGGCGGRASHTSLCRTASFFEDDYEHDGLTSSSWHTFSLHYENRYETGLNGELIQSRIFISEPFSMDVSIFGFANPVDPESLVDESRPTFDVAFEDEDDLSCAIPENYKKIAENSGIDVVAYLGLTRAKPLLINTPSDTAGEWE